MPIPRAILEIGPYDLPEPPGGWVDLVLDDDEEDVEEEDAAAVAGAGAPHDGVAAVAEADPAPAASPPGAPFQKGRAEIAIATAAKRWFLVPEALVVAAFVLLGSMFLG
ncbi:MAG TPA: hypothetical protein VIV57_04795, partial [Anaeromyxobacter sp.]